MALIPVDAPTKTLTINGVSFDIPVPYAKGHVLEENEANSLNQTFVENIRNNMAKSIEEMGGENGEFEAQDKAVQEYVHSYEFGQRAGGSFRADPVKAEAMRLAKGLVRESLRKKGAKLADISSKEITEAAARALDLHPRILEQAKANVAEAKGLEDELLAQLG